MLLVSSSLLAPRACVGLGYIERGQMEESRAEGKGRGKAGERERETAESERAMNESEFF